MRYLFLILLIISTFPGMSQNPCERAGVPYSSLPADTTIILPQGTMLTFNRCEFFDLRDCLDFDEMYDPVSVESRGFTTQDANGNMLLTCGMFRIRLNTGCSERSCFEVPVKIRMPYRLNLVNSPGIAADRCARCAPRTGVRLYTSNGGNWDDTTQVKSQIIEIDGKKYFEFYATCANRAYNCDCRMPGTTKIRFKSRHVDMEKLLIRSACPVGILKYYVTGNKKRKIDVKLPCTDQEKLFISCVLENGKIEERVLTSLDHGRARKNCKSKKGPVIRRILGIFPVRGGAYFRKYFVN